jgi:hypothetical protein
MPLHADNALILRTLNGLDDAVGGCCHDAELVARLADRLMVEGVDVEERREERGERREICFIYII